MKHKFLLLLYLFLFMITTSFARDLDLNEAINLAIKNNIDLQMKKVDIGSSNIDIFKGLSSYFPKLKMQYSKMNQDLSMAMKMFAMSLGPAATQMGLSEEIDNFDLSLTIPIFTGGARLLGNFITLNKKKLSKLSFEMEKNNIVFQTKINFLQLLFIKKQIAIQKENMNIAKDEYNVMKAKYEHGEIPEIVMNTQKINFQNEQNKLLELKNQYTIALEKFKRFLKVDFDFNPVGKLSEEFPVYNKQQLINKIVQNKTVQILNTQIKLLEKVKWLNISSMLPSVVFSRNLNYKNSEFSWDKNDWQLTARNMLIVNIPLFENYNKILDFKKSANNIKKARLNEKNVKDKLLTELISTLLDLQNNQSSFNLIKENYQQALDNYKATKAAFEKGEVSYTDLDKAKLMLNQAQIGYYGILLKKEINKAKIEYLTK